MRIAEGVAALRREAHAAHDVQPAALHVRDALVVVAVDVVKVPVGVADDGLHPHFERARPLAVWRHLEEVAAAVRRHAHAPARLRDAEELLPQGVVPVDVVDVAFAVSPFELLQELRVPLADGEVDVARADRHDLHHPLRALAERRVEEERVDFAVVQGLHRAGAGGDLHVSRRQAGVLEVLHAVVVGNLPLRHGRVADAHPRPFRDLRGHQLHRARRRGVQREVHQPKGLDGEVEVLQQFARAERGAYHVGGCRVHHVVLAELEADGLHAGRLEHVGHYRSAEVVVSLRPEVEFGVALAVRDPDAFGIRRKRM